MCVVSMVMDHFDDRWRKRLPEHTPWVSPYPVYPTPPAPVPQPLTPEEIEHFRELVRKARAYDRLHNEPDCELEDKKRKLRELASSLGATLTFPEEEANHWLQR